jgi:hypothetical protein
VCSSVETVVLFACEVLVRSSVKCVCAFTYEVFVHLCVRGGMN